jgi:putative membrane protein
MDIASKPVTDLRSISRKANVSHGPSLWFGTARVAIGAAVNPFSAWRYFRLVGEMNSGQFPNRSLSRQGVIVALFLALVGIAMTIYLTLAPGLPPEALHT